MLLTSHTALIDTLKNSAYDIPARVLKNARTEPGKHQVNIVAVDPSRLPEAFVDLLGREVGLVDNRPPDETYSGVIVLYEEEFAGCISGIRDGIFAAEFDGSEYIEKRDFFLIRSFGRILRNFLSLLETMRDKTRAEAAILPARNFDSKVFRNFIGFCQEEAGDSEFHNKVVPMLTAVTKLRGPRRRSTHPKKYFRDDRGICFEYGFERHASFETGGEHTSACSIRGLFRLGVPLEQQRHFNVMSAVSDTTISGEYFTCHDDLLITRRTHLNMFSNDFLK